MQCDAKEVKQHLIPLYPPTSTHPITTCRTAPLGQLSFFLLTMQFARAQLDNLGVKPYTGLMKQRRADRLCTAFPKYSAGIVEDFSKAMPFI